MAGKKGMKKYPEALKEKAVLMHLEEGMSIQETVVRLGTIRKTTTQGMRNTRLKCWRDPITKIVTKKRFC